MALPTKPQRQQQISPVKAPNHANTKKIYKSEQYQFSIHFNSNLNSNARLSSNTFNIERKKFTSTKNQNLPYRIRGRDVTKLVLHREI